MSLPIPEYELTEFVEGEEGERVEIETPAGMIRATWLGTIGENGWTLTDAARLMCEIVDERDAQSTE